MATKLDDLLALLPDNNTGDIDAEDLRTIVTELWNYTTEIQADLNHLVVSVASMVGVGEIDTTGTITTGPDGWTATRLSTGVYQVTHNLGTENYAVAVTPMVKTADGYTTAVTETTANTFTLQVFEVAQAEVHDAYVSFILVANR